MELLHFDPSTNPESAGVANLFPPHRRYEIRTLLAAIWRITVIRKKGEYLGTVAATDAEAEIKVAIKEFGD
jgi:hypothetical protein